MIQSGRCLIVPRRDIVSFGGALIASQMRRSSLTWHRAPRHRLLVSIEMSRVTRFIAASAKKRLAAINKRRVKNHASASEGENFSTERNRCQSAPGACRAPGARAAGRPNPRRHHTPFAVDVPRRRWRYKTGAGSCEPACFAWRQGHEHVGSLLFSSLL